MSPVVQRPAAMRLGAALVLLVGMAGCAGASGSTSPGGGSPAPTSSTGGGAGRTISVTMTDAGCPPAPTTISAGPVTFQIVNQDSGRSSEAELVQGDRILGEKENLTPGLSGSFSLELAAGDYEVYCPGAITERTPFTVTAGSSAEPSPAGSGGATDAELRAALRAATVGYATYVRQEVASLVSATARFAAAVEAGDIEAAKALYPVARIPYERIEPVAESFGDLDPAIDIRIADVDDSATWTGFHRLEKALWVDRSLAGMTPIAKQLVADVGRLEALVETAAYQPAQLANGASELLDEVASSKVTGEEEAYSRIDLVDFAANSEGARAAFELLRPALDLVDPALSTTISDRFADVATALARYKRGDGYVLHDELTQVDIRSLSAAVAALAEPLSQVAAKVVHGS
jgi:iron uptake system component EfeO